MYQLALEHQVGDLEASQEGTNKVTVRVSEAAPFQERKETWSC